MKAKKSDRGELLRAESDDERVATDEREHDEAQLKSLAEPARNHTLSSSTWVYPAFLAGP